MSRPMRARRSRYRYTTRVSRSLPAIVTIVFIAGVLFGASLVTVRALNFLHALTGNGDVVNIVQNAVAPEPGSVAYMLQHNQPVHILVLGVGGQENDAPNLSDTMMAVTLDPASHRVVEASIPRDTWMKIDAWADHRDYENKINTANDVGSEDGTWPGKLPQYTGRDGGGHLAEHEVETLTGMHFDRYVTVDFVAFRDIVDALGGVTVHLDTPLDDCHYPDYHNGYINRGVPVGYPCPPGAGIHFKAGDFSVNGEQALEISRSRDAVEPEQSTDFARAKRQQMVVGAIRKKALSVNALTRLDQLLSAVQNNVKTDMSVNDIRALYDWGGKLPDSAFIKIGLTASDLLQEYYLQAGSCGAYDAYVLCPIDPSFRYLHFYFANSLPPAAVTAEHARVQILNASYTTDDVDDRVQNSLRPFGFDFADTLPTLRGVQKTVVYDYSGGRYPASVQWLSQYFGAQVVVVPVAAPSGAPVTPPPGAPAEGDRTGIVVVIGHDFAARFYGRAG